MCFTKILRNAFRSSENSRSLLLLKFLPACIMVNSICLVVFVDIPCLYHFDPNDSVCAYAHNHQVILINYLSGSDVILDMSWFLAIQTFIDCPTKPFLLIHPWSERMLLILRFVKHDSFVFKRQTIQVFLESDASAFFLPLIEYRYSHQLCCGSPDPLLDYYPAVSFIFDHLVRSSTDT